MHSQKGKRKKKKCKEESHQTNKQTYKWKPTLKTKLGKTQNHEQIKCRKQTKNKQRLYKTNTQIWSKGKKCINKREVQTKGKNTKNKEVK